MLKRILILCLPLLLIACSRQDATPRQNPPLRVKTMVLGTPAAPSEIRYVGTIEPAKRTPLSMQSTGRVTAIHVRNGQRIKSGEKVLEIDPAQALNALHSAEASLRHAQDGYDRLSKVYAKGVVSPQKMVEIESQLTQAQSLYQAAKKQLSECTLIAPCNGVVDKLDIEIGQTVLPGAPICAILDMSAFNVRFTVPEQEIRSSAAIQIGTRGCLTCNAVDLVLPIVITEKGLSANALTHTYDVVARIEGGTDQLMNGMVASLSLLLPPDTTTASHIVVPSHCILLKPEGPTVWIVEKGVARRIPVRTGGYEANGVHVIQGLNPGDTLIVEGYQKIYNGSTIISEN